MKYNSPMRRSVSYILLSQLVLSSIYYDVSHCHHSLSEAFALNSRSRISYTIPNQNLFHDRSSGTALRESKIPKEIRAEIYRAEANTEAAKGRTQRVIAYSALALLFLVCGMANVAFSTMKQVGDVDLTAQGYEWVDYVPLLSSTWGGYVDIIAAGLFGTMVELENRTRDEVAEKIWEELERRKTQDEKSTSKQTKNSKQQRASKKSKRLAALAEVMAEQQQPKMESKEDDLAAATTEKPSPPKEEENKGMFDKLKDFYNQADRLAASQALILNKKLEDEGILEKITDETGLKVIGKQHQQDEKEGNKDAKPAKKKNSDSTA